MSYLIASNRLRSAILAVAVFMALGWASLMLATNYAFEQAAQQGRTTLRLTISGLKGALGQYRALPQLIADNKDLQALLAQGGGALNAFAINRQLAKINQVVGASDTYVMDLNGLTIAASNYDSDTSFIGRNFSFRPYFQDAIAGRHGRFFALGTTSLKRGYYFSAPVLVGGEILGVVAVKVDIEQMEAPWRGLERGIAVVDDQGIIFMSSRADWQFKSIRPLSAKTLQILKDTRKYDAAEIGVLPLQTTRKIGSSYGISQLSGATPVEYLLQRQEMPAQGWSVYIFSPSRPARTMAYTITAALLFVGLSIMLGAAIIFQRRHRLRERMEAQQEAQAQLEIRVKERTFDLDRVNRDLIAEVSERKLAEKELRKTQADLVQAGKLAALGQMSAALSHEMNQPLAAVKSYADNAGSYLDQDNTSQARDNITQISALVDRMALISKHLRNFARKPNEKLSIVPVTTVINDAVELLNQRISTAGAQVEVVLKDPDLWVVGGQVRLQQVLVNLINNGLDATENAAAPCVEITAWRRGKIVHLTVSDNGTGVADDVAEQVFDPFYTTKGVSKGLGLGLSISYNIIKDFGGRLSTKNRAKGGATFEIRLKAAAKPDLNAKDIAAQ